MKRKLLIFLVVGFLVVIIPVIAYYSLTSKISKEFKTSEPKAYALSLAQNNKDVIHAIGGEIAVDSSVADNKQNAQLKLSLDFDGLSFGSNAVDLEIPIKGDTGKALLYVVADKKDDTWIYETLTARIDSSSEMINLNEN